MKRNEWLDFATFVNLVVDVRLAAVAFLLWSAFFVFEPHGAVVAGAGQRRGVGGGVLARPAPASVWPASVAVGWPPEGRLATRRRPPGRQSFPFGGRRLRCRRDPHARLERRAKVGRAERLAAV